MKKSFVTIVKITFYLSLTLTFLLQAADRKFNKHTFSFNSISVARRGSPAITDFDGNGILDLIIGDQDGKLWYYKQDALNDTNFTLQSPQYLKDNLGNDINAGLFCSPIFYDIDDDGLIDLLISGMIDGDDKIFHYEQTSSGAITFTKISEHFVTPDDGRNSLSFSDIDGDNLLDLFVGKYNGTISHYEQDATNSYAFSLITNKFNNIDVGDNSNPTITDFFNDGTLDLIIGSEHNNLHYYKQSGTNSTTFNHVTDDFLSEVTSTFTEFLIPIFVDIDNDGLLDLIAGESEGSAANTSKFWWYEAPIAKTKYIYYNDQATATTADGGGEIFVDLTSNVTERGVCWSTSPTPTISDSRTSDGTGTGEFDSHLTGLTQGTHYYMRAYATNNGVTNYGNEREFDTDDTPTVVVNRVYDIEAASADVESEVDDNGDDITKRGLCWNTTGSPVKTDSHKEIYIGEGKQQNTISGLSSGTTYYLRAYATNSLGTSYSNEETFTTNSTPTVSTNTTVTNITATSASSGGDATNDNGESITEKGVCWSITENPTISDSHTSDGTGTGAFTSSITGLTKGTTYYIRAYATNSVGTGYGDNVTFTTNGPPTVTVDTTVTEITTTTATSSGEVTDNNGESVTMRGVCWSTSQNPTTANSHTSDGTGTGTFNSSITALSQGTTYYIRTYATNSLGTGYSDNVSFTTDDIPTVTTTDIYSIGVTTAICKGNVTSDNGDSVTERGVCWSTSTNPTLSDSYAASDSSGEGEFNANISGLSRDTKYYARAYATNSVGTSYGSNLEFTTQFQLRNMLNFDGVDNYTSTSLTFPIPGTIESWVKFDNVGDATIFHNYSASNYGWTIIIADGGHIIGYTSAASIMKSTTVISSGKWYHIALTWSKYFDGSNYKLAASLLINGNIEVNKSDIHIDNPGSLFTIGARNNQTNFLNGQIDELRIWNVTKTETQIRTNMHKEIDPTDTDLFCYYSFDNADGTSLPDKTTNNYIGTLNNMENEDWEIATAPSGNYGTSVRSDNPTPAGATGKTITADISSTVTSSNYLGIYTWGDGDTPISGEIYPSGISQRVNIVWGIKEFGDVTADLVFDYSGVPGITDDSSLRLLKRTNSNSAWGDVTSSATQNSSAHTFSMTGLSSFSEFSIADNGENTLPVELNIFTANSVDGNITLNWSTATEVNNYGFEVQRSSLSASPVRTEWETLGFVEGHGNSNASNNYSFTDINPPSGTLEYRLKQIDTDGSSKYYYTDAVEIEAPKVFKLVQNYPNPFNPTTVITYSIPNASDVTLKVYNIIGEVVSTLINQHQKAGKFNVTFNASNLPSGVYFYSIQAGQYSSVKKMLLLK